ncbi:hypothetical protein DL767_008291 [Monosporascus sp. MG133]|nr:hypothetical protein DL767_008291 [Monosporascus sp. MG133]
MLHRQHQKHAAASRDLHDVNSNTFKSEVYGAFKRFFGAEMSLTTVDHKAHAFRRRVNAAALTPSNVRALEDRVTPHVDFLVEAVQEGAPSGGPDKDEGWSSGKDMAELISYFIADIMGDVTFSQHWNVQRNIKNRHFVHDLPRGVAGMHLVGHMQSLFLFNMHKLLFSQLIAGVSSLMNLSRSFANKRLAETGVHAGRAGIRGKLMIIGGTDGMITATTGTLFYLLHSPSTLERLTRELREAFPVPADEGAPCPIRFASQELQNVTYLTACINETMRLSPSVPSILPRKVGPGGIIVDGEPFPAGTDLGIPHYSLHRNAEVFPEPLTYKPERWMPGELSVKAESGAKLTAGVGQTFSFTPFGAGRSGSVGKFMAYAEMSYILARLIWEFDLRLQPGNTLGEGSGTGVEGRERKDEFQLYCCMVSQQNGPVVQFRRREDMPVSNIGFV